MIGEFGYHTGRYILTPSYYIKPGVIVTPKQQADLNIEKIFHKGRNNY